MGSLFCRQTGPSPGAEWGAWRATGGTWGESEDTWEESEDIWEESKETWEEGGLSPWGSEADLSSAQEQPSIQGTPKTPKRRQTGSDKTSLLDALSKLILEAKELNDESPRRLGGSLGGGHDRDGNSDTGSRTLKQGRQRRRGRQGRQLAATLDDLPTEVGGCKITGYKPRTRTQCKDEFKEECKTIQETKYRTEIDQQCRTKVAGGLA